MRSLARPQLHPPCRAAAAARLGAEGFSYPAIVACGANGLTLHYIKNSGAVVPGEMLLVDAGASYFGYASDVTRTWPVDGVYTPPQREVYDIVLRVQACLARVRVCRGSLGGGNA